MVAAAVVGAIITAGVTVIVALTTGACCLTCVPWVKKGRDKIKKMDNNRDVTEPEAFRLCKKRIVLEHEVYTKIDEQRKKKNTYVKTNDEWERWCGNVDKKIEKWTKLEREYAKAKKFCYRICAFISRARVSEELENEAKEMVTLQGTMDLDKALTHDTNQSVEKKDEFLWLKDNVAGILKELETNKSIGFYGEPGIGKTMIMRALEVEVKESCLFQDVIFVTLEEEDEEKIYQSISDHFKVGLDKVAQVLKGKKYLLLLDQVTQKIDLRKLGVVGHGKVVVATRSRIICDEMKLNYWFELKKMDKDNAIKLFWQTTENKNVDRWPSEIVKQCGQIPQLIKAVAAHLESVEDWEQFEKDLQESSCKNKYQESGDDVYNTFKIVLQRLGNRKKCYTYASLFPPEQDILKDHLVEYWWAEGLFDIAPGSHILRRAREEGYAIIQHLRKKFLLVEGGKENCFKMPLRFREWTLESEGSLNIVGLRDQVEPIDAAKAIRISLMGNSTRIAFKDVNFQAVSSLFLRHSNFTDQDLEEIRLISYFVSLRVLDLGHTNISQLPASVSCLCKLKALYLNNCRALGGLPEDIKHLSANMEILDICGSGLPALPQEIAYLNGLRCLRVSLSMIASGTIQVNAEPTNIIAKLTLLEEFTVVIDEIWQAQGMKIPSTITQELASLNSLNVLCLWFPSADDLANFIRNSASLKNRVNPWKKKTFRSFKLIGCPREHHEMVISQCETECYLKIYGEISGQQLKAISKIMKQTDSLELINHNTIQWLSSFGIDNIAELKVCVIKGCKQMKSIINCKDCKLVMNQLHLIDLENLTCLFESSMAKQSLSNLTILKINNCRQLKTVLSIEVARQIPCLKCLKVENCPTTEVIISGGRRFGRILQVMDLLPFLESLELINLDSLRSFCENIMLVCLSLQKMEVHSCWSLQNLSLVGIYTGKRIFVICHKNWWEKIPDEEKRFRFQPAFTSMPESHDAAVAPSARIAENKNQQVAVEVEDWRRAAKGKSKATDDISTKDFQSNNKFRQPIPGPLIIAEKSINEPRQPSSAHVGKFEKSLSKPRQPSFSPFGKFEKGDTSTKREHEVEVTPVNSPTTVMEVSSLNLQSFVKNESTKLRKDSPSSNDKGKSGDKRAMKSENKLEVTPLVSSTTVTEIPTVKTQSTEIDENSPTSEDDLQNVRTNGKHADPVPSEHGPTAFNSESAKLEDNNIDKTTPLPRPRQTSLQQIGLETTYGCIAKVISNLRKGADGIDDRILEETRQHLCTLARFPDIGSHKKSLELLNYVLDNVEKKAKSAANLSAQVRERQHKAKALLEELEQGKSNYEKEQKMLEQLVEIAKQELDQVTATLEELVNSSEVEDLVRDIKGKLDALNKD